MRSRFCGSKVGSWTGMERFAQIILMIKHVEVVQSWVEAEIQGNAMSTHQQKGFFEPETKEPDETVAFCPLALCFLLVLTLTRHWM